MKSTPLIALEEIMASRLGSIDPSQSPDEIFDLYSIPAFDRGEPDVTAGSLIGSTKQFVQPGDVLLSKIVPHIRRAWVVGANRGRRTIASSEWIVFRNQNVEPRFLRHALVADGFHNDFLSTVSGVGGSLLRARPSHVAKIRIPLPSLAEQRRIADILDKADAIRRKREEARALAQGLSQSTFRDRFLRPRSVTRTLALSEVAEVRGGIALSGRRSGLDRQVPYLRVANVFRDRLDLTEIKLLGVTDDEFERTQLATNDVLIVEGHGNPAELGRAAVWDGSIADCVHQNHLIRVRPNPTELHPVYLSAYLNADAGRNQLLRLGKTTSGLNTISLSNVRSLRIELPPIDEQEDFAEFVVSARATERQFQAVARAADELFHSLVQRAFRGEL